MSRIKKVKYGGVERMSFASIDEIIDIPFLIETQKSSYKDFVEKGIGEVFEDFSPVTDFSNRIELHFLDYKLEDTPKYTERECKDRDTTYSVPLKVNVRQIKTETGEVIDQEVFMGEFPLMTPNGSFIVNGAERVVVSQLVRSPGAYFNSSLDRRTGEARFSATNIPSRGAWLEYVEDDKGLLWVQVDRTRKIHATALIRALNSIVTDAKFIANEKRNWIKPDYQFGTDAEIAALFFNDPLIMATLEKDISSKEPDGGIVEMHKKLRPGEVPNVDSIKTYLENLFFDRRKYDFTRIGRYKHNKKLSVAARITNQIAYADIISPDGELLAQKGAFIDEPLANRIQHSGVNEVAVVKRSEYGGGAHVVIGNSTVDINAFVDIDTKKLGINEWVHYPTLRKILAVAGGDKKKITAAVIENKEKLICRHLLVEDVISTINYILGLKFGIGFTDHIDHLGNRRVRSVGELLQNQFRVGIARLERVIKERMQIQNEADVTPQSLMNIRPVSSAIKEFFGSSQLSQFMDETNPIAELTHKRKLSALGPGGLNRERASFEVRDVHYTHYSRLCPIETPEGQNIGLISSLSSFSRINEYGFIEAPYRKVDKKTAKVTDEVHYLTADEEDKYMVAQAGEPLDEKGCLKNERVLMRHWDDILEKSKYEIDYIDISAKQMISIATALIPFLENDDTNRALMGSNMQRQAVPLLIPEAPIVGTGIEHKIAYDSGVLIINKNAGVVSYVDAERIEVTEDVDGKTYAYTLKKFIGSNQGTCINQRPIVHKGERVNAGQVLADGHSTQNAELSLGRNILIGFMSWEGYNYEDAILVSEKIVKDDVFTSIHIEEHEVEARDTKLGEEEITRDIPNVGDDALKNLDEFGIVRIGAEVKTGDILVGKVTPKGETELTPEERLLRAIFGEKAREVRDTSLKVPNGEGGIVVDVKVFTRANKDEMTAGVNKIVRVYIAQKRKISVGDKMAGRHGNKGVISRILPEEDMPFMADGTPLQIVLNPLGVPSRMNIGQVLEVHLGLVAKALGWKISTPVFDGATEADIEKLLRENNIAVNEKGEVDGKVQLYDGRTGEPFENRVTVGYMYMIKLIHLVDDKIHARSTGPYSLVTQQPLGGKAQFGGQRFGEMEVWALYAYGAANILQEIMTVKSDDVVGRVKTYESIVKGFNVGEPGIPESFKVLIKELQALSLDVKILAEGNQEIGIRNILENDNEHEGIKARKRHFAHGQVMLDEEIDLMGGIFDDDLGDDDLEDSKDAAFAELFGGAAEINIVDPFADRILTDDDLLDDELLDEEIKAEREKSDKKKKK
ncbi:MAG: DNA-directed RNA polymerase subunit beta [Firmicutes bacterium]|nr:DNA-directed RNA polymerase subunit beta [Bacillota bacterium]